MRLHPEDIDVAQDWLLQRPPSRNLGVEAVRPAIEQDVGWPDKWCDHSWWPEYGCRFCGEVVQRMCMNCKERRYLEKCPNSIPNCKLRTS